MPPVPPQVPAREAVIGYDAPSPALAGTERAHPLAVVLVVLTGVLAVAALGAVVVRFAGADSRAADRLTGPPPAPVSLVSPTLSGPPSPSASPAAVVDECLLGSWNVVEQRELVALPGIGTAAVTLTGEGPAVTYRADGTGVADYGTETVYAATVEGRELRITVGGAVTFAFVSAGGVTAATEARSAARFTIEGDPPGDWPASLTEWSYRCGAAELVLTGPDAQREVLTRPKNAQ